MALTRIKTDQITDATITGDDISSTFDLSGKILQNFTSIGIDDNAISTAITIDSSNYIGIGTNTPEFPLHVVAPVGDPYPLILEANRQDLNAAFQVRNTATASTLNEVSFALVLKTDTSTRTAGNFRTSFVDISDATRTSKFTINTQNNGESLAALAIVGDKIGIKTDSPQVPMQLAYTSGIPDASLITSDAFIITAEETPPGFAFVVASDTSGGHRGVFKATRSRGTLAVPTPANNNDSVFSLLGAVYDGTTVRATAAIDMAVDGNVSSGVAPQRIVFLTGDTSSRTERMRITSDGNVGIGTSSPSEKLQVDGIIGISGGQRALRFEKNDGTWDNVIFYNNSGAANSLSIGRDSENLNLRTSGSVKVHIDSSGNVGIGTSSPEEKLHISAGAASSIRLGTQGGDFAYRLRANVSSSVNGGFLIENAETGANLYYVFSGTDGSHRFFIENDEKVRIDSDGNVGIGTSSPSQKLDVNGGVRITGDVGIGTSPNSDYGLYVIKSGNGVGGAFISGAGNGSWGLEIGVHDAVSESDLVLNGNAVIGGDTSITSTIDSSGTFFRWMTGATSNRTGTDGATELMRINSSGDVGIGTDSPSQKLDVNGDASIYGVRVGRGPGAISTNTAVGSGALDANTTGSFNTAVGSSALNANTTGSNNTANGYRALFNNTEGGSNTANGVNALRSNTIGDNNTANGVNALFNNTIGSSNTANGYRALFNNTEGGSNTANGHQALLDNTTGDDNTANGRDALLSNTAGSSNTANGVNALRNNTIGDNNTATGRDALLNNTTGSSNTAIGRTALRDNTTGASNTATGRDALLNNTEGNNNVANGYQALLDNTTGSNNTANGYRALFSNTTGNNNTANGYEALYFNTTGSNNTANGLQALRSNITGSLNTATGRDALLSNTTGDDNTANGYRALFSNTTGSNNTANGFEALYFNTTGGSNTANGVNALRSNTTGAGNTANGFQALFSNTTGTNNTANGYRALFSNTTGINNTATGRAALNNNTTGSDNVATGRDALLSNTEGTNNTANGYRALLNNTEGNNNTANGRDALRSNTTGDNNTANGYQALYSNTTGNNNVANGYRALYSNTTGNDNMANGREALYSNTTGSANTANGNGSLLSNTTGDDNVANGRSALRLNTTGDNNTATGRSALFNNTEGVGNTANGYQALYSNTAGSYNVANGRSALYFNTTGSGNFGAVFLNSSGVYAPVFDPTTESNRIVMGHTAVTNAYIQVAWTVVSDARDKTQIAPVPHGLDFVNQLNPVEFKFRVNRESEETNGNKRYGFLAQEVLEVEGADNVIVDTEDPDKLKMTNEELIPVMVKAMQEMSAEIKALKAEIATLKGN